MTLPNLDSIIQKAYGKVAANKGQAYWRQHRVLHVESQTLSDITLVDGLVKGSQRDPYEVTLEVDPSRPMNMRGQCSCPLEFDCHHCAALGYAWLSRHQRVEAPVGKLRPSEVRQSRNGGAVLQERKALAHDAAPEMPARTAREPVRVNIAPPRSGASRDPQRSGREAQARPGRDGQRRDTLYPPQEISQRQPARHPGDARPGREPQPRRQAAERPARNDNQQQLKAWLGRLRKQSAPSPAERGPAGRLLYLLAISGNQARIELKAPDQKRGRGGARQTRPEPLNKLLGPQSRHTPEDQEIGRLLLSLAEPGPSALQSTTFTLKGSAGALALDLILASGRCRLQGQESQRLNQGESRPMGFAWRQSTRGWQLQATGTPPVKQVFQIDGPWYFDTVARSVGPLETELDTGLVEELFKSPTFPKAQVEAATKELNQLLPDMQLELPKGVRVEVRNISGVEPEPILTLRGLPREGRDPLYVAQLAFDYEGALVNPTTDLRSLRLEQKGKIYLLEREPEAEDRWREQLPSSALEALGDGVTYVLPGDGALAQAQGWERWLRVDAPALEVLGWTIHLADDFSLNVYSGESDWEASITNDEKGEWFDLSLGIELDGKHVNLLPLLESLLQSVAEPQELLERLAREDYLLLPVGPEQWLRVPCDRVKGMLSTLIELYDDEGLNADGSLRLNWHQGIGLGSLLEDPGLHWQGGDHLRKLAGRIKDFGGLDETAVPEGFLATLRPYQQEGLNWLQFLREFGFHGVLADDMGLGKTIQTLAHLLIEKRSGRADRPSLVIAPTSVLPNWRREAEKFAPELKVMVLHGSDRAEGFAQMAEADLILTTYALIRIDLEHYLTQGFHLLILDEAQMIKNPLAKTAQAVCRLDARHRLALSGTPVENHLDELWSIYRFLMPGFLGTNKDFARRFRTPIEKLNDTLRAQALRQRMKPFLLRRTKLEVARDLPPKSEMVQYVALSGTQRDLYETIRVALDARVREEIGKIGLKRSQIVLLDALLKLRQICCDPRLPKLDEAKKVKESAKLDWLLETVPEMVVEGRRILIFSQFVGMLDLIEAGLKKQEVATLRLTGATRKREAVVDAFQRGDAPVFLISLKAGGVGINLTAADTVIHYDPWWNPAAENQATDRAWRIGQDKPVFVYKLIAEQTVEEKILQLQQKKAQLSEGIYSEQEDGSLRIEAEELLALLEG
ncbi:MAG: SNF2-related protein [Candidatus Sericytochromatia bacterium]